MAKDAPVNDVDDSQLEVTDPKDWAAGVPGVYHSLVTSQQQMGVRRSALTLLRVNQHDGFDCPGCAWPEPHHRKTAEFCENGAKAVAEEATLRRVTRDFFAEHPVSDLAGRSDYWLGQQGRLTEPMHKAAGSDHYVPITWPEAFRRIGERLQGLDSPDRAVFYTSGRTSNEAAFLYQLFARQLGTNNLPDCSNMCHESSGSALGETIGIGKGSVTIDDVHHADLIIIAGQNPGTNHPRMLTALEEAKGNGARIIAVNPLPESGLMRFKNPQQPSGVVGEGVTLADLFLQVRLNGDLALFRALSKLLVEAENAAPGTVLDHTFIDEHTDGFEAYAALLREQDWPELERATGLSRKEIEAAHEIVVGSKRIIVCWAMGLTQHKNSVPTIREVVDFLLLRGNIGRPGAGVCPVRGHSNVQGDRTMGVWEKSPDSFLDALGTEFGFEPPREHGHDVVASIRAMRDGEVDVFFAMGGNFVAATPDTEVTEAAMRSLGLTVHVSTKLNRSHTVTGEEAMILPCLGRTERDLQASGPQVVTVEDSMSMVHFSHGRLAPASRDLLSEVAIICELAQATLGDRSTVPWKAFRGDYDLIRESVSRVVPGFDDFNRRVREVDGFLLPHPARDSRTFETATGKANFTCNDLDVLEVPTGHLLLQTVRSHDQYNTTIYGLDDRYRGIKNGRRVVFVNPDDLAELGVADASMVDLVGVHGGVERRAPGFRVVAFPTARSCAAAYFPETNVLVPLDSTAETSNTPTSKSVLIRLEPA